MAPTTNHATAVVEEYLAAPPPGTVSEFSLPLTFCDIMWIGFAPIQRLLFYEVSISKSDFIDTIIPKLKNSLNITLRHFPSLAGNLIIPSDLSKPEIRYVDGDSVLLTFAESDFRDFDYLTSNQARRCNEFYPFVPRVPESWKSSSGIIKIPLLALQVTLFPGIGICIGLSNHHVGGDGSAMYAFTKAWTKLSKLGDNGDSLSDEDLPFYDREVMSHTKEIDDILWTITRNRFENNSMVLDPPQVLPDDNDNVRATFVVSVEVAQKLKNHVLNHRPSVKHLSTFTVACTYIWTCLVKSENAINDVVDEDGIEYFAFVADPRGRSDPHIPKNYFGNCLTYCMTSGKNSELVGEEGFPIAAEGTGEAIHKRLRNPGQGPFDGLGKLFSGFTDMKWDRVLTVAGSPRQSYYEMDFGWGKPKKFEFISIDRNGALSIGGCRDTGGVEIGLSFPKKKMDAFTAFFNEGLKAL